LQEYQSISAETALHFWRWLGERIFRAESRFQRLLLAQSNSGALPQVTGETVPLALNMAALGMD
jgi:hypothetical protein